MPVSKHGTPLSEVSRKVYFTMFGTMMKKAVRDGLLPQNPIDLKKTHDKLQTPESNRVYLNVSEVKLLAETPCKHDLVKRALMFSCLYGLRISAIRLLKWSDLEEHTVTDGSTPLQTDPANAEDTVQAHAGRRHLHHQQATQAFPNLHHRYLYQDSRQEGRGDESH